MLDKNSDKRFVISLLVSILIHLFIWLIFEGVQKLTYTPKTHLTKIDASNLLILKRGQSQDPSKHNQGAPKPSLASAQRPQYTPPRPQTPPTPPTPPEQKPTPEQKPKTNNTPQKETKKPDTNKLQEQKKQTDSPHKALEKYQKDYIDPKNLSLLSPAQSLAFQSPSNTQNTQASKDQDKGVDPQTQRDIDELYGDEFGDLGSAEKDFIKNNLRDIGRITQKYLQYPRTAAYLGQDGQNAVEFYLHPNGDITDLKILKKSGYVILDRNTLKTIEIAYKDYPRPSVTTLIRIHVRYFMY
ncbi:siderophore-mediated iron transporter [Helicobacter sp. 12S02634-8]|uniref:energy transducer TonB n=1 Tax=Helicobacter sp. 12S02634-8 TaxID=1476199 RepID=UPI000BA78363|nr:energy transducer TonB [Helicobacter sp. 12S02634-8]PAF46848.1 siderophore-mediated iron transporter [Helicobacter sp. 12S02634-8]